MSAPTTLYRIYGAHDVLLYVGITDAYERRMASHAEKHWWSMLRRIQTQTFLDRAEAKAAETAAIKSERPVYNKAENGTPAPAGARAAGQRRLLTEAQAAEYLAIHPRTLRRWVGQGMVRAHRVPSGRLRFDIADLDACVTPVPNGADS